MLRQILSPATRLLRANLQLAPMSVRKMSSEQIQALSVYNACDISDALLKLEVRGAGFLADIVPIPTAIQPSTADSSTSDSPTAPSPTTVNQKIIAPASTVLFVAKSTASFPDAAPPLQTLTQTLTAPEPNIPAGAIYSDLTTPDTIVVISQPRDQVCAVVGGIMALRMEKMGAKGIVVDGRVRDLVELRSTGLPIYSRSTSTIGAGAETKAWATNVPIAVGETVVTPGDIIMLDPESRAVVSIPRDLVDKVLEHLSKSIPADDQILDHVRAGGTVGEGFRLYRGRPPAT